MFLQAKNNKSVVASPTVGVNDTVGRDFVSNDGLPRGFEGVGNSFGIDAVASPEQSKSDGFADSATSPVYPDVLGSKVELINVDR